MSSKKKLNKKRKALNKKRQERKRTVKRFLNRMAKEKEKAMGKLNKENKEMENDVVALLQSLDTEVEEVEQPLIIDPRELSQINRKVKTTKRRSKKKDKLGARIIGKVVFSKGGRRRRSRKKRKKLMCPKNCCGVPVNKCGCPVSCPHCNCPEIKRLKKLLKKTRKKCNKKRKKKTRRK